MKSSFLKIHYSFALLPGAMKAYEIAASNLSMVTDQPYKEKLNLTFWKLWNCIFLEHSSNRTLEFEIQNLAWR